MAAAALMIWPLCAFAVFRNLPLHKAIIWAVLVPYLLLPEAYAIQLPALPDIDKTNSIAIGLMLGFMTLGQKLGHEAREHKWIGLLVSACLTIIIGGAVLTVINNGEALYFGPRTLPAMRPWDAISLIGSLVLTLFPFWLARRHLASTPMHQALLMALVVAAVGYSVLILFEVRFSPQLHRMVYGFHQHSFVQHIRDGYRPMVFLEHGLWVGFFLFSATVAAFALWKSQRDPKWLFAGLWLFLMLLLSRNVGALGICIIILGLQFMTPKRVQMYFAMSIAVCVLVYPAMRQFHIVPLDRFVAVAASYSQDRASSFSTRLENEDLLLERAALKPMTGWGSWDRDQLFDINGKDITISEGKWIQTIGQWGWIGYIGLFGLLTAPLISLTATARRKEIPPETTALALICAGNLIYMIPNATLTAIGWLMFGALAGFAQYDTLHKTAHSGQTQERRGSAAAGYTRFPQASQRRGSTG